MPSHCQDPSQNSRAEDFQEMSPHHHPLHAADFVVLLPAAISSCYGTTERVKEVKYEQ